MAVVGFDTATADTAVCAMRDGKVLHEQLLGLAPEAARATRPRCWSRSSGQRRRPGLGRGRSARGWTWPRLLRRHPHRHRHRARVGSQHGPASDRHLHAGCTRPALGEFADPEHSRLAVLDARRGEVFAALYSPAGERLWEPLVTAPAELAERVAELPSSPLAAGSGAVRFRDELASRGVDVPEDADPCTGSPRGTSAPLRKPLRTWR